MATLASNAKLYGAVADALAARGFTVKKWAGWSTRTASKTASRIVTPTSVCIHHTAGNYTATTYIRDGDPGRGLPGPLTNWHITRDGVVHLLGVGYQNHAGLSYQPNYDRIAAGTAPLSGDMRPGADSRSFSANRYMMGVEVNGDGGADDFTPLQYRAAVALSAEYHRVRGWKVPRVGAHKELTRRKPGDPVANMGRFRSDVLAAIAAPWGPVPGDVPVLKLGDRLLSKNGNDSGADVSALIAALNAKGYKLTNDGLFGPAVDAAVRDLQTKAGLTVDGIVGPATVAALTAVPVPTPDPEPTPEPEPTPDPEPTPVPVTVAFKLGAANCQSYDGTRTEAAWSARADLIAKWGWSVVCLTETTSAGRDVMLARLKKLTGHTWKVWTLSEKSVAVAWDDDVFSGKTSQTTSYGTAFGHGAVCVPLTHRATGLKVDVIAQHTRPGSVATDAQKDSDIAKGAKLAGSTAVYAGDFARNDPKLSGWTRATPKRDSMDKTGTQTVDAIFVRGAVGVVRGGLVNPGSLSDHKWASAILTLGGDLS